MLLRVLEMKVVEIHFPVTMDLHLKKKKNEGESCPSFVLLYAYDLTCLKERIRVGL